MESQLACVASVSLQFWSKEQPTRVKDQAKNGVSKRAERGWGRKEGIKQAFPSFPFPFPSPLFHFLALIPFFHAAKTENSIPWSFFAPKPNRKLAMRSKSQLKGVKKGRD